MDDDQAASNAAEILADVEAGGGRFREEPWRFQCPCSPEPRTLSRLFVGKDDEGTVHRWLWVAGYKTTKRHPPRATIIPSRPGELAVTLPGVCPRCRNAYLFFPGFRPDLESGELIETPGRVNVIRTHPGVYGGRVAE